VLFSLKPNKTKPDGYAAYSINFVNFLVDGDTIITGYAYGPVVDYKGTGPRDLFQDDVDGTFKLAGFDPTKTVKTEARFHNNNTGFIHCGTNVIREIPDTKWWDQ
jgi:hypothetical protein